MGEPEERRLVGGPFDGHRVISAAGELHMPLVQPVVISRKVIPIREPLVYEAVYYRVGNVYRWEGLIEDAWCDIDVSEEVIAEAGTMIRRALRDEVRGALVEMAKGKDIGRIIWRCVPSQRPFTCMWRAIVGPQAVERGLAVRAERPAALREPS